MKRIAALRYKSPAILIRTDSLVKSILTAGNAQVLRFRTTLT
jgi:hypothetical protein